MILHDDETKVCKIPFCSRKVRSWGWCQYHYVKWWKWGNPLANKKPSYGLPVAEQFALLVDKNGPTPPHRPELGSCHLWGGYINKDGYGTFKGRLAHGFLNPPPPDLEWDHLCRVRSCVRLSHLEAVTHLENIRRGVLFRQGGVASLEYCSHGHLLTPKNTRLHKEGYRYCLACSRISALKSYRKRKGLLEVLT